MRRQLRPEDLMAVVDTREKTPFDLSPMKIVRGTLDTGDYSVAGLTSHIAIERKSLADLVMCVGRERERFDAACQRLLAYPVRAIVVEASWHDLQMGAWRGKTSPNAVMGSVLGWIAKGIPIIMGHNASLASRQVRGLLFLAARRRYKELLVFDDALKGGSDGPA